MDGGPSAAPPLVVVFRVQINLHGVDDGYGACAGACPRHQSLAAGCKPPAPSRLPSPPPRRDRTRSSAGRSRRMSKGRHPPCRSRAPRPGPGRRTAVVEPWSSPSCTLAAATPPSQPPRTDALLPVAVSKKAAALRPLAKVGRPRSCYRRGHEREVRRRDRANRPHQAHLRLRRLVVQARRRLMALPPPTLCGGSRAKAHILSPARNLPDAAASRDRSKRVMSSMLIWIPSMLTVPLRPPRQSARSALHGLAQPRCQPLRLDSRRRHPRCPRPRRAR